VENTICKISKNEPETLLNYLENINRILVNSNMIQVQKDMNIIHNIKNQASFHNI
jgi:hypothetical protein